MLASMTSNSLKNSAESENGSIKIKKKSKKKKLEVGEKMHLVEETEDPIFSQTEDVSLIKKSKKKKRSRKEMECSIDESEKQETCAEEKDIINETHITEKRKKKKEKLEGN